MRCPRESGQSENNAHHFTRSASGRRVATLLTGFLLLAIPAFSQTRIASDFEIAQTKQQIATSRDFLTQLAGRLNLGDLYASRNEPATARDEYARALDIAARERQESRRASDLTRYATATAYAGLAHAKLGEERRAFEMMEESIRYTADSAKSWNLYASAMTVLRKPEKAASAARNAVSITTADLRKSPSVPTRLDLAIYQYSLASSLIESEHDTEAESLLRTSLDALRSHDFDAIQRDVARSESFQIYSSARGDAAAYLAIANRAGLRLASLLERKGDIDGARAEYLRVLAARTDDPSALSALARLGRNDEERERYYVSAFDANPFSLALIRDYQQVLIRTRPNAVDDSTTGGRVRKALVQMQRQESRAAATTLDALIQQFPANETLMALRRESEITGIAPRFLAGAVRAINAGANSPITPSAAELRQVIRLDSADRLTPEQRASLDNLTFTNIVTFDAIEAAPAPGQSVFETGTAGDLKFRFSQPTAFTGTFSPSIPLRLTYKILGATEIDGADALLVEPVRLEAAP